MVANRLEIETSKVRESLLKFQSHVGMRVETKDLAIHEKIAKKLSNLDDFFKYLVFVIIHTMISESMSQPGKLIGPEASEEDQLKILDLDSTKA